MVYSKEDLIKITEYSALFLSPKEIAVLIDKDYILFHHEMCNKQSKVYLSYFKGKTMAKVEIRKKSIKMAQSGSPQAELLVQKYMKDQELDEI